jgi:hypothetical protein
MNEEQNKPEFDPIMSLSFAVIDLLRNTASDLLEGMQVMTNVLALQMVFITDELAMENKSESLTRGIAMTDRAARNILAQHLHKNHGLTVEESNRLSGYDKYIGMELRPMDDFPLETSDESSSETSEV